MKLNTDVMVKVSAKFYRCECGCNVFRWITQNKLKCNACEAIYIGEEKEPMDGSLVGKAKEIATKAHEGQTRWSGEPYITHPDAVYWLVKGEGSWIEAAAWLHDVLEDTSVTAEELAKEGIPETVIEIVKELTRGKEESYFDYVMRVKSFGPAAVMIKIADLTHNLSTSDPKKNSNVRDKWMLAKYILQH